MFLSVEGTHKIHIGLYVDDPSGFQMEQIMKTAIDMFRVKDCCLILLLLISLSIEHTCLVVSKFVGLNGFYVQYNILEQGPWIQNIPGTPGMF